MGLPRYIVENHVKMQTYQIRLELFEADIIRLRNVIGDVRQLQIVQSREYLHHVFQRSILLALNRLQETRQERFGRHLLPDLVVVHELSEYFEEVLIHWLNLPGVPLRLVQKRDALIECEASPFLLLRQSQRSCEFLIQGARILLLHLEVYPIQELPHLLFADRVRVILTKFGREANREFHLLGESSSMTRPNTTKRKKAVFAHPIDVVPDVPQ
ncbi:hypothetical protein ACHAW5_005078 [Stephanodiscus triporus]|uniref:Uncharacterized protein n=1 Tax=Stephanodiscus triporus TaxID=2934178 RepID=A0ABD3MK35_9STRA